MERRFCGNHYSIPSSTASYCFLGCLMAYAFQYVFRGALLRKEDDGPSCGAWRHNHNDQRTHAAMGQATLLATAVQTGGGDGLAVAPRVLGGMHFLVGPRLGMRQSSGLSPSCPPATHLMLLLTPPAGGK